MKSREIKFRVYCESLRVMYTPEKAKEFGGNLYVVPAMRDGILIGDTDDIYMQFTGLKDKNGKEIYESDFVVGKIILASEIIVKKGMVKYSNELAKYILAYKSPRGWDLHNDLSQFHELEIIGNTYFNPELL